MPTFRYSAYKTGGSEVTGTIEAGSLAEAKQRLKNDGLYPKEIAPADEAGSSITLPIPPVASATIGQRKAAISPALRPAFTLSKMMTRFLSPWRRRLAHAKAWRTSPGRRTFAGCPIMV